MKSDEFDAIVANRIFQIKEVLTQKAQEYASAEDRFHNFVSAARKRNTHPEDALMGMKVKHDVSVDDLVDWAENAPEKLTIELVNEKIGDNINYLCLLEGLLLERIRNRDKKCAR